MTYMGKPYYPLWMDNLADDVTLEPTAMDTTAHGAHNVCYILGIAREQYKHQEFNYAGPCGENSFIEDYSSSVRSVPTYVVVLVTFNAAGQTQLCRGEPSAPQRDAGLFRAMLERFAGTPWPNTGKAHPEEAA